LADYDETAAKTARRTLRLLDDEQIYNHLYVIGTQYSRDPYEARDAMSALWDLLYNTVRVGLEKADRSTHSNELRELGRTYLGAPFLHSRRVRNLLVEQMFNISYPDPKGVNIPDKLILPGLLGMLLATWMIPGAEALLQNLARLAILVFVGWWLITYWRRRLVNHLRDELSAEFDDDVVRQRLERLDSRRHRLPSLIFALLDQKPRTFTRTQMDEYVSSVAAEDWKEGMRLKSEWQKEIYQVYKPVN